VTDDQVEGIDDQVEGIDGRLARPPMSWPRRPRKPRS
jgi:hypothetical protein